MKKYPFFILLFLQTALFSQNTELGLLLGGSVYTGDIEVSPRNFIPQTSPAVGIYGRQHISDKFAVRALIAIGGLKGDEKKYPTEGFREKRGFNFKGTVAELSLLPEWRPISINNVHFYAFAGLSAIYVNPKSNFNDIGVNTSNPAVLEDKNQKYPKIALGIPFGGGIQWFMNETTTLGADLGLRKTFTDYLDGFSASVNPKSTDYYFIGGLTFSKLFSFGNNRGGSGMGRRRYKSSKVGCPTFN